MCFPVHKKNALWIFRKAFLRNRHYKIKKGYVTIG